MPVRKFNLIVCQLVNRAENSLLNLEPRSANVLSPLGQQKLWSSTAKYFLHDFKKLARIVIICAKQHRECIVGKLSRTDVHLT